tara:strand:+ start:804 stop:1499 length:696 start_codon:yes stop_codon:yes gene_type:complete
MPKKARKKAGKHYFTKDHENAIIQYVASDDIKVRTKLYVEYIGPAFNEMVDKIVYTYKFTTLPNIDALKDECKVWLTTILDKYDQSKGSKAFSYFSVITKNWFIHKIKKNAKRARTEVLYDEIRQIEENEKLVTYNDYHENREEEEFWSSLWSEIEHWDTGNLKENEKKVLEAVKILLSSVNEDEMIYNKKAIYLYLRELTGLNTKQVVNNLNKLRVKYRIFKKNWVHGKI